MNSLFLKKIFSHLKFYLNPLQIKSEGIQIFYETANMERVNYEVRGLIQDINTGKTKLWVPCDPNSSASTSKSYYGYYIPDDIRNTLSSLVSGRPMNEFEDVWPDSDWQSIQAGIRWKKLQEECRRNLRLRGENPTLGKDDSNLPWQLRGNPFSIAEISQSSGQRPLYNPHPRGTYSPLNGPALKTENKSDEGSPTTKSHADTTQNPTAPKETEERSIAYERLLKLRSFEVEITAQMKRLGTVPPQKQITKVAIQSNRNRPPIEVNEGNIKAVLALMEKSTVKVYVEFGHIMRGQGEINEAVRRRVLYGR